MEKFLMGAFLMFAKRLTGRLHRINCGLICTQTRLTPFRFATGKPPDMPSPKRDNDLHVRICDEADALLDLLASANNKPKNMIAAEFIERCLLGECHSLKIAALRFSRLGLNGSKWE